MGRPIDHASGAGPTDEVTAAIQTLFRLGGSRRIHQRQVAAAGVSLTPQSLRVLERVVESGSTTPTQLAHRLDLDPAVATRVLRQLEDAGLIKREPSPQDGRVTTVEATAAGTDAMLRVRDVIWDQVRRTLAGWPDGDVAALADLLGRLVTDVQKEPYRSLNTPNG